MPDTTRSKQKQAAVDFNLHGLIGIRLLNPTESDQKAVQRQLGLLPGTLAGEPDIIIRWVDHLDVAEPLRYLGVDEAGFTTDAFLVLRSKHKTRSRVQIPFQQIGQQCEIVCESGLPAVPLLIPIINLTALAKGALPLHASAFTYKGTGILTTGWSKGGKTEALLAFMEHGAQYIGDEWVYIDREGHSIYGIPEAIRLWEWYLQQLPSYASKVDTTERLRLRTIKLLIQMGRLTSKFLLKKSLDRVSHALKNQLHADIRPQKLFAPDSIALAGTLNKIFWVASHADPHVRVEPVDPTEIAQRMVFSLQYERLPLMAYYLMYRFAFPNDRNDLIENAEEKQRQILGRLLAGKDAYTVYHPYPAILPELFEAMQPYISQ